jgi:orotate phosphoribosyltransferase
MALEDDLLALLQARKGHFEFESGHHGELWLDLDALFRRPRLLRPFVDALAKIIARYRPDAICGPLTGGALLAQAVAAEMNAEFFYSERHVKTTAGKISARYALPATQAVAVKGKRVAVIDDVINAASAVRGTVETLEQNGAKAVAIAALAVFGERADDFGAEKKLPVIRISGLENQLWAPASCPLCRANEPLERLSLT